MLLTPKDVELFFKLHRALMFFVNQRLQVLPSRLDDNPMVWMLQVNGFMVDVRHAPREVQEIAFKKGLIPYIPADRQRGE